MARSWGLCVLLVVLGGCAPVARLHMPATLPAVTGAAENWIRTELYFGLTRRDGSAIAERDWRAFVAYTITPAFPDGFTVIQAQGQYMDEGKMLHVEPTRVVVLLHPRGADADKHIDAIMATYIAQFDQESVLKVESPAAASFVHAEVHARP